MDSLHDQPSNPPTEGLNGPAVSAGLHSLIERQARLSPEAVAVRMGETRLTYSDLNRRANQCAHYLRDLGVGPEVLVGVLLERSVEMIVGLLGILKAGGAYLPLAPDLPLERLRYILEETGVSIVLTRAESAGALASCDLTSICLDHASGIPAGPPTTDPVALTTPQDLAYVIYTSGSTGRPKGCMNTHAAICNRLVWMRDHYGVSPADRILQKTPYTFDVSVWELFLPLLSGACLVFARPGGHKDNRYLVELVQSEGVTICHFVPSMLRFFLRQSGVERCRSLRHVFVSGEALPYDLMRQFLQTLLARLHNLYGPTEAAVDVTFWECRERPDKKAPIGRPISNTQIHILDPAFKPVPPGETGELFIGGIGVGRGYFNRPDLTRERFVRNPLAADSDEKLYRTGDKARLLPNGEIEFLGRLDFQVKVRGFRIELGEIEETLRSHDGIEDAAVLVRDEDSEDPKLVAYILFKQEHLPAGTVREFVKSKLPEYMAPNLVVALKSFPVGAHGKLDRNALPWPVSHEPAEAKPLPAPEPARANAQLLVKIVAELLAYFRTILRIESLAATDDLFDAGATSFTMVQAVDRIQSLYGVTVPVDLFFDTPNVEAISAHISKHQPAASPGPAAPPHVESAPITLKRALFSPNAFTNGSIDNGFSGAPVTAAALGRLLSVLRKTPASHGPSYLYSSAGGLRPVQAYLFIKRGGVDGVEQGYYYYHPGEHRLYRIASGPGLDEQIFGSYDRPSCANAGFALFLIAQLEAIQPIYHEISPALATLEAGYLAQALLEHRREFGASLRPTVGIDFEKIRSGFQLGQNHRFLHCLLGGAPAVDSPPDETIGLAEHLRATRQSLHGHCSHYEGAATFSHFLAKGDQGDVFPTPQEAEEHHRKEWHLRHFPPGTAAVNLEAWDPEPGYYLLRSAKRVYQDGPVAFENFSLFLSLLSATPDQPRISRVFASITGSLGLKIFVWVKSGGVVGLPGGLYRYDGLRHELRLVKSALSADLKSCFTPFNRKHFQLSSFCLFLVSSDRELRPVFGDDSNYLALLEAGYIGQLLLDRQAEFAIGVCPIGGMRFEKIRDDFQLDAGDDLLHAFVGGGVPPECAIPWPPLEERPPRKVAETAPALPKRDVEGSEVDAEVAIVGLSGRFPGASNLDKLAENLASGKTSFRELRFAGSGDYRGGNNKTEKSLPHRQWGGFMDDVDCFDSLLFQIPPAEARAMDPQERLFMEAAWECLENGGYTGAELNRAAPKVGVFVGAMWDDYQHHSPDVWLADKPEEAVSAHHSSIANRTSFFFNFNGPSVAVNTSCSSALTALHYACQSLKSGDCDAALAGGVNLMAHPYHHGLLSAMDFLSKDDECSPFGLKANGWVAGEGVGMVLLKRLADALRDGDTIHGVVLGTTVSHSGRTRRYGTPDSQQQAESIREALAKAGVSAGSIGYIEAAAPGAGMADAAEAAALKAVFGGESANQAPVYVGSIKGNIGHLESASAVSQLAKVLLQFRQDRIFPTHGFLPASPLLQWDGSPLRITDTVLPWPSSAHERPGPRRALINAFGATGSGGHIILQEPPMAAVDDREQDTLILLSAATQPQLVASAQALIEYLGRAEAARASIADIGFTLRVGRAPMKERLACVIRSRRELSETLETFAAGQTSRPGLFLGRCENHPSQPSGSSSNLWSLAENWVLGACVVGRMGTDAKARRVPLPTYPFAKDRHWVGLRSPAATVAPSSEPSPHQARIVEYLKGLFAAVTEIPRDRIETRGTFDECGMTSIMVKRLTGLLETDFGPLPATLLFERQTIEELGRFFSLLHPDAVKRMFGGAQVSNGSLSGHSTQTATHQEIFPHAEPVAKGSAPQREVAIVGISGRYPKSANVFEFWENLSRGVDCISEIPSNRWNDPDLQNQAGPHSKWGGFIEGIDEFDPFFFRISPSEAVEMDPQERLFLQTVWHLFEDAGYDTTSLDRQTRSRMGVFVGVMYGEYQLHSRWDQNEKNGVAVSSLYGSIANRVSYYFDFHGPSMAVDTLCSSSLTALHLAAGSILSGECEAAVVGGVNLSIHPNKYMLHARMGMSSSDGRCRSFGDGGDGFVPGEGVGAVLLKPLDAALRDGDHVYGIVRATVVNHDGKTHGYTVPNPNAQADMIREALQKSGVNPRSVGYVEAHGTGTSLGDPIEIAGLTRAFGEFTTDKQFCAIGSLKSNIGHLEAAAGIAGLTKILLQIRHRKLVPSLHSAALNPAIHFEQTPFVVQQTLADWNVPATAENGSDRLAPRLACISSFGAGGSNAHAMVGEHIPVQPVAPSPAHPMPQLFVLSARNEERLQAKVAQLHDFLLRGRPGTLADLAYTLQIGRAAMEERLAFAADSFEALAVQLKAILERRDPPAPVCRGSVDRRNGAISSLLEDEDMRAALNSWIDKRKYDRILEVWVKGAQVDWARLHGTSQPRRVSLPGYPFAREHYWVSKGSGLDPSRAPRASQLHPLLHANTSDLWQTRFSSELDGSEFFLSDHKLRGQSVLPAAALVEMARAAVQLAAGAEARQIRLKNVVWIRPFSINKQARPIHATLRSDNSGELSFEIHSGESATPDSIMSQGGATFDFIEQPPRIDLRSLREGLTPAGLTPAQCYQTFQSFGLEHGPGFLALQEIHQSRETVLVKLMIPTSIAGTIESYGLHPALLDGVFQATLALQAPTESARAAIPYSLDELVHFGPCEAEMWACVRRSANNPDKLDLDLCEPGGSVCARIRGFSTRPLDQSGNHGPNLVKPVLRPREATKQVAPIEWSRHVVVLCGVNSSAVNSILGTWPGVEVLEAHPEGLDHTTRFESVARKVFGIIQENLRGLSRGKMLVQLLVSNAPESAIYRGLSPLLQSARAENPDFFGQLIATDPGQDEPSLSAILRDNSLCPADVDVAYQAGRRFVPGWEEMPRAAAPGQVPWKNGGVYLITGGAGGLGLVFSREIIQRSNACTLILTGRSPLSLDKQSRLRSLEKPGCVIRYYEADVTDRDQTNALVAGILREHGTLTGVLHAAGVLRDNFILKKTASEFAEVLAPKTRGTVFLDEATKDLPLDFFALFSSTAGALGNAGQADYAAANGFLDAFAIQRDQWLREGSRRGRSFSVNWPLWKEGGMKVDERILDLLETGDETNLLESAVGLGLFAQAFFSDSPRLMVQSSRAKAVSSLVGHAALPAVAVSVGLPQLPHDDLREKALHFIRELVASTVQCPVSRIQVEEPFEAYGIDSIMAMRMTRKLEQSFGSLSKTLFFEYLTVQSLTNYFLETKAETLGQLFLSPLPAPSAIPLAKPPARVSQTARSLRESVPQSAPAEPSRALDVAVIGLAGRYPQAGDLEAFWKNLCEGRDCITEIPADRWDWKDYYDADRTRPGAHYSKWGGFIEDVDKFDPLFFNIAPNDARHIDPQERLFLETSWAALEDAGCRPEDLRGKPGRYLSSQVGVYAGVMYSEYQLLAHEATLEGRPTAVGGIYASIANRVSYFLDLHGPSMTVDTMCSSSLTCVHLACQDLKNKVTDLAIAGGVNVTIHPNKYLLLSSGQFISTQGHCGSFGQGGDGYIPGEGVGVAVLKRLSDAIRDGDHIYGVIKGGAVNHGGKTNGFTVPNPNAQQEVITKALESSGLAPSRVSYIEAHGTGTELGDPIEIAGLTKALGAGRSPDSRCWLGAVKSNIGHGEAAAGIAGLTKLLLQMKHGLLAPSLHSEVLNPHINFASTPFAINQTLRDWDRQEANGVALPRVAGISGFGAGGSNAHLVVEEFLDSSDPSAQPTPPTPWVFVLSARNQDRLKETARLLHQFVQNSSALPLPDVAYTLQLGRQAMDERAAFVASSREELLQRLDALARGNTDPVVHRGTARHEASEAVRALAQDEDLHMEAAVERWMAKGRHARLLDLWVTGFPIDWRGLHRTNTPRRISLPTYPFARERYWLPRNQETPTRLEPHRNGHVNGYASHGGAQEWLAVTEDWVHEPMSGERDWNELIRKNDGARISVLAWDESQAAALIDLAKQLGQAGNLDSGWRMAFRRMDDLSPRPERETPEVVLILAPEEEAPDADQLHVKSLFQQVQNFMREAWNAKIRFYHFHARSPERPRPHLDALSGLWRSAMLENPNHLWRSIVLDGPRLDEDSGQILLQEWLTDTGAPEFTEIRHQPGGRQSRRMIEVQPGTNAAPVFRTKGTYVMAGGLGPVGEMLCQKLAAGFQATLVVLSRGALDERKMAQCREIEAMGSRVHYFQVDVADRAQLAEVWSQIKTRLGAIHGVIHLARSVEDGLLLSKPAESVARVISAKVEGTLNLDEITAAEPLDFFLMFSSMGAFGVRGSADYAYSAAFQNAFARVRASRAEAGKRSGKTLALDWGGWTVDKYHSDTRNQQLRKDGFQLIGMDQAFPWIESRAWQNGPVLGLMRVHDAGKVKHGLGLGGVERNGHSSNGVSPRHRVESFLEAWEQREKAGRGVTSDEVARVVSSSEIARLDDDLADRLHALLVRPAGRERNGSSADTSVHANPDGPIEPDLANIIAACLKEILGLNEVDPAKSFQDYGMDSVSGVRFSMLVEKQIKREVQPQWLVDHSTTRALAAHLNRLSMKNGFMAKGGAL